MIQPIIMAGGSGTRLWPISRAKHPKQFLPLVGQSSMLQATSQRLDELAACPPITLCNEEHRFIVAEQLRAVDHLGPIVLEPEGRNTAPAVALAAHLARAAGEDPLLLVLAADHDIREPGAFCSAIQAAIPLAEQGKIVTFGVVPHCPHTGYGYIRRDEPLASGYTIASFVEKPDPHTAQAYLDTGEYYWNSGIFLVQASRYLEELEVHRPDIAQACLAAITHQDLDNDFVRVDSQAFLACPDESIDYAIMEHTNNGAMVPLDAGWSDVGSWAALWELNRNGDHGNALRGDVITHQSRNCLVHGDERLVAAIGVKDLVIVDTADAVMVAHKDFAQDVKTVVNQLKQEGRPESEWHRVVYRPWGKYDSIDNGSRFQVKHITVKPGAKLSVQMHHHRSEHWIVVSGTARVTRGEDQFLVSENESTYIPIGTIHALENPGKVPLELIEVQSGTYLGEDDIIRFDDKYGRT